MCEGKVARQDDRPHGTHSIRHAQEGQGEGELSELSSAVAIGVAVPPGARKAHMTRADGGLNLPAHQRANPLSAFRRFGDLETC